MLFQPVASAASPGRAYSPPRAAPAADPFAGDDAFGAAGAYDARAAAAPRFSPARDGGASFGAASTAIDLGGDSAIVDAVVPAVAPPSPPAGGRGGRAAAPLPAVPAIPFADAPPPSRSPPRAGGAGAALLGGLGGGSSGSAAPAAAGGGGGVLSLRRYRKHFDVDTAVCERGRGREIEAGGRLSRARARARAPPFRPSCPPPLRTFSPAWPPR